MKSKKQRQIFGRNGLTLMDELLSPTRAFASLRLSGGPASSERRPDPHSSPELRIELPADEVMEMLQDEFATPLATPLSAPRALEQWLLDDPVACSPHETPRATPLATPLGSGSVAWHGSQSSCTCAICLSPVRRAPLSTRRGISFGDGNTPSLPRKVPFRTQCCGQLFHRSCLTTFKEQAVGNTSACPLCRSERQTGLTPHRLPTPHTGFVGASSMRSTMRARAAAARLAVQRGLSARTAAEEHLSVMTARAEYASPSLSDVDGAFNEALVAGPWIPADGPSWQARPYPVSSPAAPNHSPAGGAAAAAAAAAISASAEWRAARYRQEYP